MREALALTDEQTAKLGATEQWFGTQRRALLKQRHDIMAALRGQLRPGIAANADSMRNLLDAGEPSAAKLAELRRDAAHEMAGYLTPVQRARLLLMRAEWRTPPIPCGTDGKRPRRLAPRGGGRSRMVNAIEDR